MREFFSDIRLWAASCSRSDRRNISLEIEDVLESSLTEEQLLLPPYAAPKERLSRLSSSVGVLVPLGSAGGASDDMQLCFWIPVAFDALCCR